ncbi:MAG: hypothetical protein ACK41E_11945 [Deinococcales bacterium]
MMVQSQSPVSSEPLPLVLHQLEGTWLATSPYQVWQQLEFKAGKIGIKVRGQPSLRGYFALHAGKLEITLTSGITSGRTIELVTAYTLDGSKLELEFSVSGFCFEKQ